MLFFLALMALFYGIKTTILLRCSKVGMAAGLAANLANS
jgi:hypothetical protein